MVLYGEYVLLLLSVLLLLLCHGIVCAISYVSYEQVRKQAYEFL